MGGGRSTAGVEVLVELAQALADPPQANATITRSYHLLSNSIGHLLHGDGVVPENATFTTFAGWAAVSLRAEVVLDGEAWCYTFSAQRAW